MSASPNYQPRFPAGVDDVTDTHLDFDDRAWAKIDTQIRSLQRLYLGLPYVTFSTVTLPDANTTLTNTQWLLNATGGIILAGTLTATRVVTVPTVNGVAYGRLVTNKTTQTATINASSSSATIDVPPLSAEWIVFDGSSWFGTSYLGMPIGTSSTLLINGALGANVFTPLDSRNQALAITAPSSTRNGTVFVGQDVGLYVDTNNITLTDPLGRSFLHPSNGTKVTTLKWGTGDLTFLPAGYRLDMRLVTDGGGTQLWV